MTTDLAELAWDRLADAAACRAHCGNTSRVTMAKWRRELGFPQPLDLPNVERELWDLHDVAAWWRVHLRDRAAT